MSFPIEIVLRQIIAALLAVSVVLVAFGSGVPASHAMGNAPSCAGAARADTGGKAASPKEIKISQGESKTTSGKLTVSGPGKQSQGAASAGVDCCGSYCAPAFSLSDRHPGMTFSRGNEVWTAACDPLQSTEPSGTKRPPRAASSQISRA